MVGNASRSTAARHTRAARISALVLAVFRGLLCSFAVAGLGGGATSAVAQASPAIARESTAKPAVPSTPVVPAGRSGSLPAKLAIPAISKTAAKGVVSNPSWKELSAVQQEALSPLAGQWDTLDAPHRAKWLQISRKFDTMNPDEKTRIQERMRAWVALTPEQRRIARDIYARTKKLNTDQKSAQWEQYQKLPEEQKRRLAAEAAKTKVASLPPAHSKPKVVPSIRSLQKPALQRSVTPQPGAAQASMQETAGHGATPHSPVAASASGGNGAAPTAGSTTLGVSSLSRTPPTVAPTPVVTPPNSDK